MVPRLLMSTKSFGVGLDLPLRSITRPFRPRLMPTFAISASVSGVS